PYENDRSFKLREIHISKKHRWCGCTIRELKLPERLLIVMIKRGDESVIPSGATEIAADDIVVVTETEEAKAHAT
ncbi:MAG: K+/H+ antiporter, partial [Oscillospiraceae bacterium]|nr:K+/H+ antiporter [Oscillospiraceae bacterium]